MRAQRTSRAEHGFSMIEILITLIITVVGLLGLAGFITHATSMGSEASQRARASALLIDMGHRLANNKTNAAAYITAAPLGDAAVGGCAAQPTLALRDRCEWNDLLAGANDAQGAGATAQALTFRGCVSQPAAGVPVFVITVAWGTTLPGVPPADLCAAGAFGDDAYRRILRTQVRIANLTA